MSPDGPADVTQTSPGAPAEPLPEQIGRYRILGRLGAGGMGTVYKAHDPQLDRVVALKLPHLLGPPRDRVQRAQRFQREARAAAQVWHPHVCPIYDVGEHDGQPYVVMACLDGESLAERLAGQRRFDHVGQAVALARQILDALEAVHARGIIHRDLKPGNIIIGPGNRAVLTDFGLARPENDTEHLTSEGVVVGTPAYMAPEQAGGESARVGPWTDLYSLGVVLYQMLTGRLPFEGPPLTVLTKILHDPPPPPSRFRPDLDPTLEGILLKSLAKEPGERYQTARPFAET
jgi:serine/threonine protein kinase